MNSLDNLSADILETQDGLGRIDCCTNCGLPLPLLLPEAKKPAGSWICNGCGAQYDGLLDTSAATDSYASIRPLRLPPINVELHGAPEISPERIHRILAGELPHGGAERRRSPRYPIFIPFAALPVDAALGQTGETIQGTTRNLSTSGIALLASRCVSQGLLLLKLQPPQMDPVHLLMRIVECRPLSSVYEIRGPFLIRLQG